MPGDLSLDVKRRIALASGAESLLPSGLLGFVQSPGGYVQLFFADRILILIVQKMNQGLFKINPTNISKICLQFKEKVVAFLSPSTCSTPER